MLRVLPLLAFTLLFPAAVAAPVPPDGRPEFGVDGLLTRADLERVRFDSRPIENGTPGDRVEDQPKPARGPGRFDVAVHLPWTKFRQGEPIPAYFVLKNVTDQVLELDAQLELYGPEPTIWNSCSIELRNRTTGKSVPVFARSGWRCGGPALTVVPPKGFYCVKGDLGRTADDKPLLTGEYEVDWRCGQLGSAPVKFTVGKTDGPMPVQVKRPGTRFYHLSPRRDHHPDKIGKTLAWGDVDLCSIHAGMMASALAVGQSSVFVPDVHAIPSADRLIAASVEWKPYRDGDRVVVTLRSVDPLKRVRFDDLPQLHLQIETPGAYIGESPEGESAKDAEHLSDESLVTPLIIEARLPIGWRERGGVRGATRVAVLISSARIELPSERKLERLAIESFRRSENEEHVWSGLVRTAFIELRFPPRDESMR